jgi:hypothetical protein
MVLPFNTIITQRAVVGEPIENIATLSRKFSEEYTHQQNNGTACRAITPRSLRAEQPEEALEDPTVVDGWAAGCRFLGWEQRL